MTHQEILTKAIEKAIANGWDWLAPFVVDTGDELGSIHDGLMVKFGDELVNIEAVIYDHDFAKALWGEDPAMFADEDIAKGEYGMATMTGQAWWQYHLQQLVISEDPIHYLEQRI